MVQFNPEYQPTSVLCQDRKKNNPAWCGCSTGPPSLVVDTQANCEKKKNCRWSNKHENGDGAYGFRCKDEDYDETNTVAMDQQKAVGKDVSPIQVRKQRTFIGDSDKETKIHRALRVAVQETQKEIVQYLLAIGADPNFDASAHGVSAMDDDDWIAKFVRMDSTLGFNHVGVSSKIPNYSSLVLHAMFADKCARQLWQCMHDEREEGWVSCC